MAREFGDRCTEIEYRDALGGIAYEEGQLAQAAARYVAALDLLCERGGVPRYGELLDNLSVCYAYLEQPERAHERYMEAPALAQASGAYEAQAGLTYNRLARSGGGGVRVAGDSDCTAPGVSRLCA